MGVLVGLRGLSLALLAVYPCLSEDTTAPWGYATNTGTNCGDSEANLCGPDSWSTVSTQCADNGFQSPVDFESSHIHTSHKLDEIRYKVLGCSSVSVTATPTTWKVEIPWPSCSSAFKLQFEGHSYYATHLEFHSPSEHTHDSVHSDMEVQITHSNSKQTSFVVVSVLLDAKSTSVNNPFLAPIWDAVLGGMSDTTDGQYTFGVETDRLGEYGFNFVDDFLPSLGLGYDYYYYDGSQTSPSCEEETWIVLKHHSYLSTTQLNQFLTFMANHTTNTTNTANKSKAKATAEQKLFSHTRLDGTNNRPIQPLHTRVVEYFHDAACYLRYCHNIFDLGEELHLLASSVSLLIVVAFTLFFETLTHTVDHFLESKRTAGEMVSKIHKELSVLGLVSFVAFTINSNCSVSILEDWFVAFEFVHILIFFVALLYVMFSGILLFLTSRASRHWDRILLMDGSLLIEFLDDYYSNKFRPTGWAIFGRPGPLMDLGIVHCQQLFIQRYQLPGDFDFLKYIKYYLSRNIRDLMEISSGVWILVTIFVLFWGLLAEYLGKAHTFGPIGWINVLAVLVTWALCFASFARMLKLLELGGYHRLKENIHMHKGRSQKVVYAKELREAHKEHIKNLPLQEYVKTPRGKAQEKHGMHKLKHVNMTRELTAHKRTQRKLQSCWVPFGSPLLIRTSTNITMLAMCFYSGFYLLNARSYLSGWFQHVLVVSSVVVVIAFLMPFVLLALTTVEAIVQPDHHLIGEVLEYTEDLHQIRARLVDAFLPTMELRLFADVTEADVKSVLLAFDRDHNSTIDFKEFVEGCHLKNLRLSEVKMRRFVRMLDCDRNGQIDAVELFDVFFQERIARIDRRLLEAFVEYGTNSHHTEVSQEHLLDALHVVFGEHPPQKFMDELLKEVVNPSQDAHPIDLFELRLALVRLLSKTRLDVKAVVAQLKEERAKAQDKRSTSLLSRAWRPRPSLAQPTIELAPEDPKDARDMEELVSSFVDVPTPNGSDGGDHN